jgi:hypothetical protein
LVKITRFIHQFATGNFADRIQLREKDQLQALANALNGMAASLAERDRAIREEILNQVDAAKRALYDGPTNDRSVQAIEHLSDSVNRSFEAKWEAPVVEEDAQKEPVYS